MIKKKLTVLLAACLLVGAISVSPITVNAEESNANDTTSEETYTREDVDKGNQVTFKNTLDAPNADVKLRIAGLKADGTLEHIKDHKNLEDGWNEAMDIADETKDKGYSYIVVDLYSDWTAEDGEFTDAFFNGAGFNWDAIYIPDDAKVILNLNGHTIDRGLKDYEYNGEVMYVDHDATLIINGGKDSSDTTMGKITGGFSCNGAGGIHINDDADVTLNNVSVSGNSVEDDQGAGIALYDDAKLVMNGGEMANNTMVFSTYRVGLSWITYGGCVYAQDGSKATFNGVKFYGTNIAEDNTKFESADIEGTEGACIAVNDESTVILSGCEVYDNDCGLSLFCADDESVLKVCNGTKIYNNTKITENDRDKAIGFSLFTAYDHSEIVVNNSSITGNYGNGWGFTGRQLEINANNMTATDNKFGVFASIGECSGTIENCVFNNNFFSKDVSSFKYSFGAVDEDVVFKNCDFGDSKFYAPLNIVSTNVATGFLLSQGALPIIVSFASLALGIASIVIVLVDRKKRNGDTLKKDKA